MTEFITALTGTTGITAANLWSAVSDAAPLIVIAVLFAFSFKLIRKIIKGISRGRASL